MDILFPCWLETPAFRHEAAPNIGLNGGVLKARSGRMCAPPDKTSTGLTRAFHELA